MAAPSVRAIGTMATGQGDVTATLPSHDTNDIILLLAETLTGQAAGSPGGSWAAMADSPQDDGANSRLTIYWLRAASSAESNPTITDPGNHCMLLAISVQDCILTGDPWDVTSGGTYSAGTGITITGDTTTGADRLIVTVVGTGRDADSAATFSNWANASQASFGEVFDQTSNVGGGGGFGIATGTLASAGGYGNTTVDVSTTGGGYITIALKPLEAIVSDRYDFGTEPSNTVANATMTSCTVRAEDAGGNLDTSYTGDVTVALTVAGGANLGGTLTRAAVAGVATFNNLTVDKIGTYTLTATGNLTSTESASFNITADRFDFGVEPSNTVEGATITSPTVRAEDGGGNLDTSFTGNVTVAIDTNPGSGTLSGTLTRAAVAGVATFNDLSINNVGTGYTLIATGGLTSTVSATFNITLEPATHLAFGQQPSDTQAAMTITPAVTVRARNSENVTDTNYTADVVIALQTGTGVLSGTLTKAAVAGVATFDDLSVNLTGTKTLRATSGALTLADSTSFDITSGTPPPDRTMMYARRRGR